MDAIGIWRRIWREGVPERRLRWRSVTIGFEMKAKGNVFGKGSGFRQGEVINASLEAKRICGGVRGDRID